MTRLNVPPVVFATYSGDCTGSLGTIKGPTIGTEELLTVVEESFDPDTGKTRLGFAYGSRCCECFGLTEGQKRRHSSPDYRVIHRGCASQ